MVICDTIKTYVKQSHKYVKISSPCDGSVSHKVPLGELGDWRSFCPNCKRPIRCEATDEPLPPTVQPQVAGRYAFVVVLWGGKPGYILGAMVLGKSLRKVGTKHELILLHTSDVPDQAVELLAKSGWKPRRVEPIDGVKEMYSHAEPRFKGVFSKLRVLSLTEYEKVCCMDIDTLAIKNIDDLFDLQAPAANGRGPQSEYKHGDLLDGSTFFRGSSVGHPKSWGHCWGINAGVMVLRPDEADLRQMMLEVLDRRHPSHIQGNGPEQDYLSRYWAKCWSHVGVEYNFQLHQMYHVLHSAETEDARPRLMRQFLEEPIRTDVRLIHYSGSLKPWDRYLGAEYADSSPVGDALFFKDSLEQFNGYWLWAKKDPETVKWVGQKEGVMLGPNGKLHWIEELERRWDYEAERYIYGDDDCPMTGEGQGDSDMGADRPPYKLGKQLDMSDALVESAEKVCRTSLAWWKDVYIELATELCASGQDLAKLVATACTPAEELEQTVAAAEENTQGKKETSDGWRSHGQWWVQHPVLERATVVAGRFPQPFATFACCDTTLFNVSGSDANGIFAVSISQTSAPSVLASSTAADVKAWAMHVDAGAAVLIAILSTPKDAASAALHCMVEGGFEGLPTSMEMPDQCALFVLSGRKGDREWWDVIASADFAKATVKVPSDVQLSLESLSTTKTSAFEAVDAMAC